MNELFPIIRRKRRPLLPVESSQADMPAIVEQKERESNRTKATEGTSQKEQQHDEQPPTKIADGESE